MNAGFSQCHSKVHNEAYTETEYWLRSEIRNRQRGGGRENAREAKTITL
jgi:hypothetical protein